MLRDLVFSFDCDDGQDARIYMHAKQLFTTLLGLHVSEVFRKHIRCQNDMYYLSQGSADDVWNAMCKEAKKADPNS